MLQGIIDYITKYIYYYNSINMYAEIEERVNKLNIENMCVYNITMAGELLSTINKVDYGNIAKYKCVLDRAEYFINKVTDYHIEQDPMLTILEAPVRDQLYTLQKNINRNFYNV